MIKLRLATAGVSAALLSCIASPASAQVLAPSTTILWNAPDDAKAPATLAPAPTTVAAPCADCAPAAPAPAPDFGGCWRTRLKATGDWGGFRNDLACNGITLDASLTQFYQGVDQGGRDENYFYGGRLDFFVNVDMGKLGLMKGGFLNLHAESIYGQSANGAAGTVAPVSLGQLFPNPSENDIALSGIKYTQFLSQNFAVFGGKINTLDDFNQPYAGGRGNTAFMNMSLGFPLSLVRTVPYSAWGGGFAVVNDNQEVVFSAMALDTNDTTRNTGFPTFFNNGVTLLAQANLPVTINGLPGHQGLMGTYSTGEYRCLDRNSYFNPQDGTFVPSPLVRGSWSITYMFDQALFADCCNPKRTWGVFGNLGIADDNPSPIRWMGTIGVGGASFSSRPNDTFGIGYFYTGLGENVKTLAPVLLPLGDEQGVELFYNLGVTPWCHISPDVQVVLPGRERIDTTLLFGLRMKIDF